MKVWAEKIKDFMLDIGDISMYKLGLIFAILRRCFEKALVVTVVTLKRVLVIFTFLALFFSVVFAAYNSYKGQYLVGFYFMLCALVALFINKDLEV